MHIPAAVVHILTVLEQAGFEAFLVGGCVRDLQLGRPVHDWDVTTSARPEQVLPLFPRVVPTGLRHGTVTVLSEDTACEVTTFRSDGVYSDARRPDSVHFVPRLEEDLSRRDFTINAMAMDLRGQVIDCHGGRKDLQLRCIRCVGDPARRFTEDALRMLRAIRFSAQLGFKIEDDTRAALMQLGGRCALLSCERIRDEIEKTLLSPRPEALGEMIDAGLLAHLQLQSHGDLGALSAVPPERLARWAQAKHMLPQLDLFHLRLEKRAIRLIQAAASCYDEVTDRQSLKLFIAQAGWDAAALVASMRGLEDVLQDIRDCGECVTLQDLAVSGADLTDFTGTQIRHVLQQLLAHVLRYPQDNRRELLLQMAKDGRL